MGGELEHERIDEEPIFTFIRRTATEVGAAEDYAAA